MRRHTRSEKRRKILRRIRERERGEGVAEEEEDEEGADEEDEEDEEEGAGAAEIGSRVFPFRTPAPAPASPSMPTVGTRRSTRVFVPKQQQRSASGDGDSARVVRSGKQFALSMAREDDGSDWLKVLGGGGGGGDGGSDLSPWWKDEGERDWKDEVVEIFQGVDEKKLFGVVYSRKRRRSTTPTDANDRDRRFGIVFERKHRKKDPKARTLVETVTREVHDTSKRTTELRGIECSNSFVEKLGVLDSDLWSGSDCGPLVLAVLVDSSVSYSSDRFARLLVSVMNWTRRARAELLEFVAFVFGRSICSVFSSNGIHFVPLRHQKNRILDRDSIRGCGFCKIYGARDYVPLLFVGYSALPSYFKFLHAILILGSQYLPRILRSEHLVPMAESSLAVLPCKTRICGDHPLEMGFLRTECVASKTPAVMMDEMTALEDSYAFGSPNSVIINGSRLRKHQRKRSSLKNARARNLSSINSPSGSFRPGQNGSFVSMAAECDFAEAPVSMKPLDSCLSDLLVAKEESDTPSSPGSCSNLRKSAGTMSPMDKIKEMRLALAEVRQNIDSTCSNVNILVFDAEKCWREDGARVVLEMSGAQEWLLAVKRGDTTRFLHKPHDLKSYATNRFTHAYIWSGDDGWKLEFCDKWDWHVFKELHTECQDRNTQEVSVKVKVISVPGVREVSGYEDDATPSFIRPDIYIHKVDDEVGRALTSEISHYDMDSADEDWLRHLKSGLSDAQDGSSNYVSEENFERIIFTLEKDAYSCPDDASDKDRAFNLCQDLGSRDVVSAIYDYWLKKRKQKHKPLTRVFQFHPPLRRAQLVQKPFLRKKRSLKRQRCQLERNQAEWNQARQGKHDLFLQAHQEAVRRVQEAEAAASRAAETATQLRTRAQLLMSNADLAAYKAAMALRIAEAIAVSSSSSLADSLDQDSSILFD